MKSTNYIFIFIYFLIFTNCKDKSPTKTENFDNNIAFDFSKDIYQSFDTLKSNSDAFTKIEDTIYKFKVIILNKDLVIDNVTKIIINNNSKILFEDKVLTLNDFEKQLPLFLSKITRKNFGIYYENNTNIKDRLMLFKIIFSAINKKNDSIANKLLHKNFEKLNSKEKELLEEKFYTRFLFDKKPAPLLPPPPENL